jgi:hypothetical protein
MRIVYFAYFGRYSFLTPYFVRAFSSGYLKILYFTSSKTHYFILAIKLYKTTHIPLFILDYLLLNYHKTILFLLLIFCQNIVFVPKLYMSFVFRPLTLKKFVFTHKFRPFIKKSKDEI